MKQSKGKKDIDFLYEIGSLRLIQRQWQRFHLQGVQNLTEHHYRVIWLALIIAAREGKGDTGKIMKMALLHDIGESRTNDVDYLSRQYVVRNEEQGVKDMLDGTSLEDEFLALRHEYEARKSIESRIVKDADNLDVDLELHELAAKGNSIEKVWKESRDRVAEHHLYTKAAKEIYESIKTSNIHDWHTRSASNRLNGGDWKKS